eukprot:959496-Rhodomonas_salina.1
MRCTSYAGETDIGHSPCRFSRAHSQHRVLCCTANTRVASSWFPPLIVSAVCALTASLCRHQEVLRGLHHGLAVQICGEPAEPVPEATPRIFPRNAMTFGIVHPDELTLPGLLPNVDCSWFFPARMSPDMGNSAARMSRSRAKSRQDASPSFTSARYQFAFYARAVARGQIKCSNPRP